MEIYRLVFNPIEVNTYIVADKSGDCAIIDCGCYDRNEFSELENLIDKKNLNPVLLLNTHCHPDHVFGNRLVLEKFNLGTYCNKEEEMNRENAVNSALMFGLLMDAPPVPAGFLTDNQKVTFGTLEFTALCVPGHTKGSLAFYNEEEGVVFTGDALFAGGIGRTDLPGGNFENLLNSIKTKLFTLPGDTTVYPGHGGKTTIRREMETNRFFINT